MPLPSNKLAFSLLLCVVLLAPLPLGANRPWAWSALGVAIGVLLLIWAASVLNGRTSAPVPFHLLALPLAPFALVLAWGLLQSVGWLSEGWWHPLWLEAAATLGQPVAGGISVDPYLSRTAAFRLLTYGGVFWLAVQLGRERTRAVTALRAVAGAGVAYASYGLLSHFMGWETILWLPKWAYFGDVTSTFVNRNAYGAYAGLGMVCCLGLILAALRRRQRSHPRQPYERMETFLFRIVPAFLGLMLTGTALLLSHSRGAFVATCLGLVALILAAGLSRMIGLRALTVSGAILAITAAGMVAVHGEGTLGRIAEVSTIATSEESRPHLYRLTVDAIVDAPWTGYGMGTFLPTFRIYRDAGLSAELVWDYAHNVYLEAAMDLGVPIAVLLFSAMAIIVGVCVRGLFQRRRDHIFPATAIAAAILLGSHSLLDFSAQMPAVAMTFALLLGVGYAQSWPSADLDEY